MTTHPEPRWLNALATFRPLVTIDPEDAEQVARLARAYMATWMDGGHSRETTEGIVVRQMHAALREFANPPEPECGRQLTVDVDAGRQGSHDHYVCRKPEGHAGRHEDIQAAATWNEVDR